VKSYVVFCHPTHESFAGAALERVLAGLRRAGHEVRVSDLYADGFRPELDEHDRKVHHVDHREHPELRPEIARVRSTTCAGATRSCSSTRRGGQASRPC
jgi:putative NADPH-quinone reductase